MTPVVPAVKAYGLRPLVQPAATLAAVLLRLEQRTLLTREVDVTHRRRRLLRLTDAGVREVRRSLPVAAEVDAHLLARLSPDERERPHALLTKLVAD